eukprot:scaffold58981_cov33-Attheya_sp.AAC.1
MSNMFASMNPGISFISGGGIACRKPVTAVNGAGVTSTGSAARRNNLSSKDVIATTGCSSRRAQHNRKFT